MRPGSLEKDLSPLGTVVGDRRGDGLTMSGAVYIKLGKETPDAQPNPAETFERAGWTMREGLSEKIVGEGGRGRYAIRPAERLLVDETVFEMRGEELNLKAYARKVPTPERAAKLLKEYGVPAEISDVTPGKVPMVPPEAEEVR